MEWGRDGEKDRFEAYAEEEGEVNLLVSMLISLILVTGCLCSFYIRITKAEMLTRTASKGRAWSLSLLVMLCQALWEEGVCFRPSMVPFTEFQLCEILEHIPVALGLA